MLRTRVIPCLLLKNNGLVKTVRFGNETYIGDPLNAVKIFNEKEVDELIFLDITATKDKREPNLNFIYTIATECFMPFCYGGGINNIDTIKKLLKNGAEKVSLGAAAFFQPDLVKKASDIAGSQAISVSVDVKRDFFGKYKVFVVNGTKNTGMDPITYAVKMQKLGAGELFINNIDLDGTMKGYDVELLKGICSSVTIPVVACGGASSLNDFKEVVTKGGASAVAAGSLFVYHGRAKGILINYPSQKELTKYLKYEQKSNL